MKPALHVMPREPARCRLGETTWEQRRTMTAAELIKLMGPLHVDHADFKPRPRSLLPMPNLTGLHGDVVQCYDSGIFAHLRQFILWAMR